MNLPDILKRVQNKSKQKFNDFVFDSGMFTTLRFKNNKHIIFNYHGIDVGGNTRFNHRHVLRENFEKQVRFLKKYCRIISLQDFYQGKFIPNYLNVALTFDDGFQNNFTNALPIIEKYRVPATFFITGINTSAEDILWPDFLNIASKLSNTNIRIRGEEFVNRNGVYYSVDSNLSLYHIIKKVHVSYDFKLEMMQAFSNINQFKKEASYEEYWKLMSDEEIVSCSKSPYIEIGSHGLLHQNLGNLPLFEAETELKISKAYLENLIQKPVVSVGYPDGSYSRPLLDKAEELGFKFQFASEGLLFPEDVNDHRILDRKGVYSIGSPANQILSRIS